MGNISAILKRISIWLFLGIFVFTNVGCNGGFGKLGSMITGTDDERLTTFGAQPLIEKDSFEKIDLARELDPTLGKGAGIEEDKDLDINQETLRKAYEKFYAESGNPKWRRNRLQDRILGASDSRCGDYAKYLKSLDARTNFLLGTITTAIAGAGAIVTGATAARSLAGTAAIMTGGRAEFNQSYFSGKTIQVITNGFKSKRREFYKEIEKKRGRSIINYTVERAVDDAIVYHSHCSLNSGLEHAAQSIERAENPGLDALIKALPKAKKAQFLNSAKDLEELMDRVKKIEGMDSAPKDQGAEDNDKKGKVNNKE